MNGTRKWGIESPVATVPLLPLNMVRLSYMSSLQFRLKVGCVAEFRGPGVRHNYGESEDDYDVDMEKRTSGISGRSGRIILLGDGTEVLTDSDETEMFDHGEDDKDLENHVSMGDTENHDEARATREETPGPELQGSPGKSSAGANEHPDVEMSSEDGPVIEAVPPLSKPISESAIPEKLHTPSTGSK